MDIGETARSTEARVMRRLDHHGPPPSSRPSRVRAARPVNRSALTVEKEFE